MAFLIVIKLLTLGLQMMNVKQKAIIASWSGVFIFCIINLLNKWLDLGANEEPLTCQTLSGLFQKKI